MSALPDELPCPTKPSAGEDAWNEATAEQLAVLKPIGSQFVPDLTYPKIYDKDVRRINDARRLAGFDVVNDWFTMPQLGEADCDATWVRTSRFRVEEQFSYFESALME